MSFSGVLAAALAAAALWIVLVWNALVRSRNRARGAWSQIDVQLRRRHDLIPNLVTVVDRYLQHERETLEAVTRARQEAIRVSGDVPRSGKAEGGLSGALCSLRAVMERYPDLKAVAAVRDLLEQLTTTESRIAFARQHYNDCVLDLNNRVELFPQRIVASLGGFESGEYFEMEGVAGKVPE